MATASPCAAGAANDVWSADFVFDRTAEGRVLKCLTIVDDATTEAVARAGACARWPAVTRILDQLAVSRGLPKVLRTDNGPEFCSRAMLTWAHERGLTLRLIDRASPSKCVYRIVQWTLSRRVPQRALVYELGPRANVIEAWRREYNEERPKKGLAGLRPLHLLGS